MSDGNGHPYSWSAIFNGYNQAEMANCPFPVIPEYLSQQSFPEDAIADANVTHVWTQSQEVSEHIARCALIETIVPRATDMIGEVDAILLARDDANHHYEMALPFLEAKIPIYIDKPLALTTKEAIQFFDMNPAPGKLFTCSALQFAKELCLSDADKAKLGQIIEVKAQIHKDWSRYAIHMIEPVMRLIDHRQAITNFHIRHHADHKSVQYQFANQQRVEIATYPEKQVAATIHIRAEHGELALQMTDTYNAFKNALMAFITGVRQEKNLIETDYILRCIEMLEIGNE